MAGFRRIYNILRYGIGPAALERKRADKARVRQGKFTDGERWQREGDGLAKRQYASYEDYLGHQSAKLDRIRDRLDETAAEDRAEFRRRFEGCAALRGARSVVCLGARLGTEVQALHDLGYFAVGTDLNPGEHNERVLYGDFLLMCFPGGSVDAVYTNVLDHVFDLKRVMGEVTRILRPGGVFIVDALPGFEEGFTPGEYEATHWPRLEVLLDRVAEAGALRREGVRDLGKTRRDHWFQETFRKPAANP